MSQLILAQPPTKAKAPIRVNWTTPLTPPSVACSPISACPPTATKLTMTAPSPTRVSWAMWEVDMRRQPAPTSVKPSGFVARWMVTCSRMTVPAPTRTPDTVEGLNLRSCGSVPMTVPGPTRTPGPSSTRPSMTTCGPRSTSAASFACDPTTQNGPIFTPGPSCAFGSTTAVGWINSLTLRQLLELALQRAEPVQHFRQASFGDPDPMVLDDRAGVRAGELRAGGNVGRHSGLRVHD